VICPHDTLRVRGPSLTACYRCLKCRAGLLQAEAISTGGLSEEQRTYVGLCGVPDPEAGWFTPHFHAGPTPAEEAWDRRRDADPEVLHYLLTERTARQVAAR